MSDTYDPLLRAKAYQHCLLCEEEMVLHTSGYLRRHYRFFHRVTKDAAIDALIRTAEKASALEFMFEETGH
jgi:hypothetical protein